MKKKEKQIIRTVLRFAIAAAVIWALFRFGGVKLDVFKKDSLDWRYLALGFALGPVVILASIFRWQIILNGQGASVPFFPALRLTFIGFYFNLFVPGGTGGDVVKAYYVATLFPGKGAEVATTVFVDRLMGLFGLFIMTIIACLVMFDFFWMSGQTNLMAIAIIVLAIVVVAVVFSLLIFSRRFRDSRATAFIFRILPFKDVVRRVYGALEVYRKRPGILAAALGISIASHIVVIIANYLFALALGIDVPLYIFAFLVPVIMAINVIPVTPYNFGVSECAYVYLFLHAGALPELIAKECFWIGALGHLGAVFWSLLGSVFYLQGKEVIKKALQEKQACQYSKP